MEAGGKQNQEQRRQQEIKQVAQDRKDFCKDCRNFKIFHIASYRIKILWDFSGFYFFTPLPRILYIGILRCIITFHLNMSRNTDIIPCSAAIILLLKSGNGTLIIFCILKLPQTIQAHAEIFHILLHFFFCFIISVVGVSIHSIVTEIGGIFYQIIVKCFHDVVSSLKNRRIFKKYPPKFTV